MPIELTDRVVHEIYLLAVNDVMLKIAPVHTALLIAALSEPDNEAVGSILEKMEEAHDDVENDTVHKFEHISDHQRALYREIMSEYE